MPSWTLLGTPFSPEAPAWEGVIFGAPVRRTRETRRQAAAQRLSIVDRFYRGEETATTSVLELRLVFPAEAEWMLESCGFFVDALIGDYSGAPCRTDSPRLLVRAIRG
jgi:hypothetical protein